MGKCYSKSDKKRKINYHEQNWIKLNIETPALANYLMKKYPRIFKNYDETVIIIKSVIKWCTIDSKLQSIVFLEFSQTILNSQN